jgi:tetratricopeptide (TPR) repeat protein
MLLHPARLPERSNQLGLESGFDISYGAMTSIPQLLELGVQHHQSGQLESAERTYRQILAVDPDQVDALHLLGVLAHQCGNSELAIDYISRAIASRPDAADAHYNLALAQQALKRYEDALGSFRQALRFNPEPSALLHHQLGNALAQLSKFDEAAASYRCALALEPKHHGSLVNLGRALTHLQMLEEAADCYRRALETDPQSARTHYELGLVLTRQGKLADAEHALMNALRLEPDFADAHHHLGGIFIEQRRETQALQHLEQAVRLKPQDAEIHHNLGNLCRVQGLLERAVRHGREAVRLSPQFIEGHINLGVALRDSGQIPAALQSYERAIQLQPDNAEAHWNRALALLSQGDYREGWQEYEWRWKRRGHELRRFEQPTWDGSPLQGRTILLHAEQGIGDTLQFVRYAPLVKHRGGKVLLECQTELVRLLRTCEGVDDVIARGTALPEFDVHAPIMSLPRILDTTIENLPAQLPYLAANADRLLELRSALDVSSKLNVGIVWRGNPAHQNDRFRSLRPTQLLPLAQLPGVRLYSLQKGVGREELAALTTPSNIVDLADSLEDFYDTAAVVANLDLVIGCDTSVVHLAGALAVPTWVLLSAAADWRWLQTRTDSPWYPNVKLFRQQCLGNWDDVIQAAKQSLAQLASGGRAGL